MHKQHYSVADVMSEAGATLTPDASVSQVLKLAASRNIHHFPIVAGRQAIGLVCTCDLRDAAEDSKVWQFARHPPVSVSPSSSVRKAARLMSQYSVGSVVVNGDEGLCGIVTLDALLSADPCLERLMSESRCMKCRECGQPSREHAIA